MPRRKGVSESRQGSTWTRTFRGGKILTERYKFPFEMLDTYTAEFDAAGKTDYSIRHDGNAPDLIAEVQTPILGDPSVPLVDLWDPKYNEVQQSLWLNAKVRAQLEKIPDITSRALFKADAEALLNGARFITLDDGTQHPISFSTLLGSVTGIDTEIMMKLFTDLAHGVEYQIVSSRVLVRHLLLEPNADLGFLYQNINKVFTTDQLKAAEITIPDNIKAQLVDGFWLKKAPVGGQEDVGRWNFEYEYWYAEKIGELEKDNLVTS